MIPSITSCCGREYKMITESTPDVHMVYQKGPVDVADIIGLVESSCKIPHERAYFHRFLALHGHDFPSECSDVFFCADGHVRLRITLIQPNARFYLVVNCPPVPPALDDDDSSSPVEPEGKPSDMYWLLGFGFLFVVSMWLFS